MTVQIEAIADPQMGTNSYLVLDQESRRAVIIDANLDPESVIDLVRRREAKVEAILLTHTDFDHIAGLPRLLEEFGVPVAVHDRERDFLTRGTPMRGATPVPTPPIELVQSLVEGERFDVGPLSFAILATPGHSPGSVSLKIGGAIFTGDALFAGSIGRTDLPGGDSATLMESIKTQLLGLNDDILVYSGHGPITTIGQERRYNPFLS
ncbi:MAG TPA: MBL fold metallo-hydrolase [Candidatus Dormibacteraeota bacterium]|nr:MBL fold metallo-hydrolase [Candidatus Dormibacteraeota bacterium]